ncbi:hypothetical protein KW803_03815 [Candidatus Saccharibacteria bacterium]|nr:hypothetical protein [Candidatus Saccharibacteria bacterium]
MSESKTKHYRYMIANLIDDLSIGDKFNRSALHITILPWFALETDEGPFLNWFYEHFDMLNAFDSYAAERKMFGPKEDVPVSIMEPQAKFMHMHKLALSWFGAVGARWAEKDPYVGDDYIPHIAQRDGYVIDENQTIHIGSLIMFKAERNESQVRTVAAKAILNDQQK